jgi:hypothetical protein
MSLKMIDGNVIDANEEKYDEILKDMSDTIAMDKKMDDVVTQKSHDLKERLIEQNQAMQSGGEINTQFKQSSSKNTTRKSFKRQYKIGTRP